LNASLGYLIGKIAGTGLISRIFSFRMEKITDKIKDRGIMTVFAVRSIPVTPFSIENLVFGAVRFPFLKYLTGTLLGILPGAVSLVFFQKSLFALITEPSTGRLALFIVALGLLVSVVYFVRKRFA
jgi:uncharacterized membrane protein YdjX (TVP38/TMEM64 family)